MLLKLTMSPGEAAHDAGAERRRVRRDAAIKLGLRVRCLDRVFDLDLPEGQIEVELLRPAGVLGPARAVHDAGGDRLRGFRRQVDVAARARGDLRVGLFERGRIRHALRDAVRRSLTGRAVAGIGDRRVEARRRTVEFADRRSAEAFRPGAADRQVFRRLPAQTELVVGRAAERRVIGVARRDGQVEVLRARHVLEQRRVEFEVVLVDVVFAAGRQRRYAVAFTRDHDRVRRVEAFLFAMLVTGSKGERTGRHFDDVAGDVGRPELERVLAAVLLDEADVVQHFRRDRARAAEDVQRNAGAGAVGDRAERAADVGNVVCALDRLRRLVVAVDVVDVPVEVAIGRAEAAFETRREVTRVDFLREDARTAFDRTTAKTDQVAARIEREAERVVRIGRIDAGDQTEVAGVQCRAQTDRLRSRLVHRLTLRVAALEVEADVVADLVARLTEQAVARARRQQQVVRREVEAVGRREAMEAARERLHAVGRAVRRDVADAARARPP